MSTRLKAKEKEKDRDKERDAPKDHPKEGARERERGKEQAVTKEKEKEPKDKDKDKDKEKPKDREKTAVNEDPVPSSAPATATPALATTPEVEQGANSAEKPERKIKVSREVEKLLTFNAVLENSFPKNQKNRDTRRSRVEDPLMSQDPALLMSLNIKVRKIPRSIVTRPSNVGADRVVVFVDPNDESVDYWQPAMVVPTVEWDGDMKKVRPGEVIVRYFSDLQLRVVLVQDLVLFAEELEPFMIFTKTGDKFLNDPGVQAAVAYMRKGELPPGFKWPNWGEADLVDEPAREGSHKKGQPHLKNSQHHHHHPEASVSPVRSNRRRGRHHISESESDIEGSDDEDTDDSDTEDSDDSDVERDSDDLEILEPIEDISNTPLDLPPEKFEKFLYDFMEKRGTPILKTPILGYEPLEFRKLYEIVTSRGGMESVTGRQEWRGIYKKMKIANMSTSASYSIRNNYLKYLYPLEEEYFKPKDRNPKRKPKPEKEREKEKKEKEKSKPTEQSDDEMGNPKSKSQPAIASGKIFQPDDRVLVSHKQSGNMYLAKILEYEPPEAEGRGKGKGDGKKSEGGRYFVHYHGWKSNYDEWVNANLVFDVEAHSAEKHSSKKGHKNAPLGSPSSRNSSPGNTPKSGGRSYSVEKESHSHESKKFGSQRALRNRNDSDHMSPSEHIKARRNSLSDLPRRERPHRKHHYSDEELENGQEEEELGRKRKYPKFDDSDSDTQEHADEKPKGRLGSKGGDSKPTDQVEEAEEPSRTPTTASSSSGVTAPTTKSHVSPPFRPQRSTRVPPREAKEGGGNKGDHESDSDDTIKRENSSRGDHGRGSGGLASRTRSSDSLLTANTSKDSLVSEPSNLVMQEKSAPSVTQSEAKPPEDMDVDVVEEAEPAAAASRREPSSSAPPADEPSVKLEKEEARSPSQVQPEKSGSEEAPSGTPQDLPPRAPNDPTQKDTQKAKSKSGKTAKKPTSKALARLKRRGSDSEASNDDGYRSDTSVNSNHSMSTRANGQKDSETDTSTRGDSRSEGKHPQDKFKRSLFLQVQNVRQQLPDMKIDFSELIPGFLELSCELRAEKIEARMNVLKAQYRQHVEDFRKLSKQSE